MVEKLGHFACDERECGIKSLEGGTFYLGMFRSDANPAAFKTDVFWGGGQRETGHCPPSPALMSEFAIFQPVRKQSCGKLKAISLLLAEASRYSWAADLGHMAKDFKLSCCSSSPRRKADVGLLS